MHKFIHKNIYNCWPLKNKVTQRTQINNIKTNDQIYRIVLKE